MWRLYLAAIGFVGDNPLYELGRKKRLPWWHMRPAFLGLVMLGEGPAMLWVADRVSFGAFLWMVLPQVSLPYLLAPVLSAALSAAVGRRSASFAMRGEIALTCLPPEQVVVASAVAPLRLVGSATLGLGCGWVVGVLAVGYLRDAAVFGAATVSGVLGLAPGVLLGLNFAGRRVGPPGAAMAALALQTGGVIVGLLASQSLGTLYPLLGVPSPAWGFGVFWGTVAILNVLAGQVLWRHALRAARRPAE